MSGQVCLAWASPEAPWAFPELDLVLLACAWLGLAWGQVFPAWEWLEAQSVLLPVSG